MIQVPVKDANNQEVRSTELNESVFGREIRADLLGMAVNYQLAKRRLGTATVLGRSDVRGGGKKPYRQKGTGNARQGTIRAPQFRTGGIVFGPQQRDYSHKLNKKVRKLALQTALSVKASSEEMVVVDKLELASIKTKEMKALLSTLGAARSTFLVVKELSNEIVLSARNIPNVMVADVDGVNVYDLLRYEKLVITEEAVRSLEEKLA
ncbi:LSU ribosomal protein L4P [Magnetococcus marinus MC-1]|uniref:Large ribosomal subunit protein uL4 n=1 Tax=Magnetococcus marinus (strain ATCC BAA-1437 / JCM 17883 / MC-1) TaxID=156889 RepID=RL4_MAGMM|nr:50S ribosomal protein L4 [Magnetococcus marinus]A0L5X4.1 RecName: Full=Large ribosomal subunit protein uL4; AltName: Full=50S ribosomal protein L4 [Magnetococcus marinus MC-1]ABK43367.1 LSU ribosomal protein L4P [Magnetococcus marinus MC-1]